MFRFAGVFLFALLSTLLFAQIPSTLIGSDGQNPKGTAYRPQISGISIGGAADIEIVIGNHTAIYQNGERVKATDVKDGVLSLNDVGDYRIVVKSLDLISVKGAADVLFRGIDCDQLTIDVKGACDATLAGRARTLIVNIKGAADLIAVGLRVSTARVDIKGAADAYLWVTGRLFAEIQGVADLSYRGSPWKIKTDIKGQGDITKRD